MSHVLYSSAVGSLMFAMVCTREDIAQAVGVVNFGGDRDKRKSTTDYVFSLARGVLSWVLKLLAMVALSTTEAEYMAATQVSSYSQFLLAVKNDEKN
ncbi:secreted RxLR effector protein 161-like [Cryptomeria japonica]|uniref:secreted RxLR effector protein 161-like n=1 Tax=Cryptomeria japonica TaxID=3369 RepID=UPI0027DA33DF|nr:secreted RxLR effector protein 161-like [Cryptomeria japonica]